MDILPNGSVTDLDRGKIYKTCLPVAPSDFLQWRQYKLRITDANGSDECSGYYLVIPYINFHYQGHPMTDFVPDVNSMLKYQADGILPELPTEGKEIVDNEISSEVMIFPNPGEDEVFASWTSAERETIEINVIDITGKWVSTLSFNAKPGQNKARIETSHLEQGIYIIQFRSNNMIQSTKWIKAE